MSIFKMTFTVVGILVLSGCAGMGTSTPASPATLQAAEQAYQAGNIQQAKSGFEVIANQSKGDIDSRFRLGNIAMIEGKFDQAAIRYGEVLQRNRRHAKAHYNLALVHLTQAENHFNYHTATAPETQGGAKLTQLMVAIEAFSSKGGKGGQTTTPLDQLGNLLAEESQ